MVGRGVGSFFWSYICFLASWHWHKLPRSAENFCKFYFIAFSQVESRVDVSLHIYTDIKPWNVCVYVCVLAIRAKQIASFVVLLYQYLTFGLVFCLLPIFFLPTKLLRKKRTRHFPGKSNNWLHTHTQSPGKIRRKRCG